jgi:hypothetical protein
LKKLPTIASLFRDAPIIIDVASSFACEDTAQAVIECKCGRDHFTDATLRARRDPTRTLDLRRKFIRDLERRWRKISRLVTEAVATSDMFGLGIANARALQIIAMSSGRVNAFQQWIDAALADTILGMDRELWVGVYIRDAYTRGWNVASSQIGRALPLNIDRADIVTKLTIAELQGVIEAFSQRAVRAFSDGLLSHLPPATIARTIRQAVDSVGIVRSRMTVQTMVVRANGEAALDAFQTAGHTHVQVLPETVPSPGRVHAIRDAARKARRSRRRGTRSAFVEVLTAGDDDVCIICEDIAEGNPYSIADARGLIPAHPNCRCAFVPAEDARFSHGDRAYTFDGLSSIEVVPVSRAILDEPVLDEVELIHAYRSVRGGELKVGQIFRDPNEAKLARDVSSLDAGEGSQVWEVDVTDIDLATADGEAVYLPPGTGFEVVGFDPSRNVWNIEARV